MSLVRALNATSRVHRCLNHSIRARPALGVIAHARAFSRSPVARADDDDGLNEFDEDFGPAGSAEAAEEPEEEGGRRRRTEKAGSEDSDDAGSGSDAGDGEGEGDTKTRVRLGPFRGPSIQVYQDTIFHSWKSAEGNQYRTPGSYGRNYLGGDRPFPLNPSFQPPVPMSDRRRTEIFVEYMRGGMTVRELSRKFNISLRRVEAVLRLKHLELEWRQEGRSLETGFRDGMEQALGVAAAEEARDELGREVQELPDSIADFIHDLASNYAQGTTRVKMYWEPVEEGMTPMLDDRLVEQRALKQAKQAAKANRQFPVKVVATREGRVPYEFADVGDLYVNPRDVAIREKNAERRQRMREKRELIEADERRRRTAAARSAAQ